MFATALQNAKSQNPRVLWFFFKEIVAWSSEGSDKIFFSRSIWSSRSLKEMVARLAEGSGSRTEVQSLG